MPKLTPRARKDLEALHPRLQAIARDRIRRLDAEPTLGKKLLGKLTGLRSAQAGRSHRIIYRVSEDGVTVLTIGDRKDVYR